MVGSSSECDRVRLKSGEFVDGKLESSHINRLLNFEEDRMIFAGVFQYFYLRLAIFFGCLGMFMYLFRGEMSNRTLHYWFLAPARRDVLLASALKIAVMPLVAWTAGRLVGLDPEQLFAVTVLAALPSAQNVFNYAQRYGRAVILARDVVLITTIASLPALLVVAALLAPR